MGASTGPQAEITTVGTADSQVLVRAAHVISIRLAHKVAAAALYILQKFI